MNDFTIPEVVRNKAVTAGRSGWIDEVPLIVADLCRRWGLRPLSVLDGGTESIVFDVQRRDGSPAVLKLAVPGDGATAGEIEALRLAGGDGCPILYEADADVNALLMERLGRSMFELKLPIQQRHRLLADASRRVWRSIPADLFPSGADKGQWLIEFITHKWEDLERPCSEDAVRHALECAGRRISAHTPKRAVLVHGDVHQWNALQSGTLFKLVDPDGLFAEPEYDLGIIMREDPVELMESDPRRRARKLAQLSGLDEVAIWEWGAVERVSTGLVATEIDLQPVGRQMLAAADLIAAT